MRRNLIGGLVGGALLSYVVPSGAGNRESVSSADPEAKEFLKKVIEVAKHDDLTDIAFLEKTLGFKLEPNGEELGDKYPNAKWKQRFYFKVTAPAFPIRPPFKVSRVIGPDSGDLVYSTLVSSEKVVAVFICNLAFEDKTACLTLADMRQVLGKETDGPHGVSPETTYVSSSYQFEGKNKSSVQFMFNTKTGCMHRVSITQNTTR